MNSRVEQSSGPARGREPGHGGGAGRAREAPSSWTRELNDIAAKAQHVGPLPGSLAAGIERLSGYAMDDVRVHYRSPEPARMAAHAFARGTTIHVGPGQERHLPHEAWHLVQQARGAVQATHQLHGQQVSGDPHLEHEADRMGALALRHVESPRPSRLARLPARADVPLQCKVGFEFQCRKLQSFEVKKNHQTKAITETKYDPPKGKAHAMVASDQGWYLTSDGGDPEFVVEPPIEEGDKRSLDRAFKSMVQYAGALGKKDQLIGGSGNRTFKIAGLENPVTADPQITAGIAYERLGDIMEMLAARDPKGGPITHANAELMQNKAVKHYTGDDLLLGKAKADVVDALTYEPAKTFFETLYPNLAERYIVIGVLSLMASYLRKGMELGHAYIKDFPLLAKTDMATIVWNSPLARVPLDEDSLDNIKIVIMGKRKNTREQIYDAKKLDVKDPASEGPTIEQWVTELFTKKKDLLSYQHNKAFADDSMGSMNRLDLVGPRQNVAAPILEFRRVNDALPVTKWHDFAVRVMLWLMNLHGDVAAKPKDF